MTERVWRSMKALRVLLFFTACAWPAVLWADGKCQARNEPKTAQCLNHMRSHKVLIQFFLFFFHRVWICLKSNRIMTTERSNKALKVKRWQEKNIMNHLYDPAEPTATDSCHIITTNQHSCRPTAQKHTHEQQLLWRSCRDAQPAAPAFTQQEDATKIFFTQKYLIWSTSIR